MANPAAFTLLFTYTCSAFYHLPWGQLWTLTMSYPLRNQPILLRKDRPILSTTAYWHKNNQINTTSKCRHAPKKHIRNKPLYSASAVKQEGGGISVGHPSAASEGDPLSVPPLSISSLINIGTGIYPTQPYNQPKTFRTIK
jgi:hypothetical protein